MIPQLYFLRSSEQKIVTDMLKHAYVEDTPNLNIYSDFYGLTAKDLGLYALVDNHIAGAIWSRRLNSEHNSTAFVDEKTPVLSVAVLPEFRAKGVGTFMMDQFLQEAGALYEQLSVGVLNNSKTIKFYKKFGFEIVDNSEQKIITMIKKLEKKEVFRPTDGYDPTKWMD